MRIETVFLKIRILVCAFNHVTAAFTSPSASASASASREQHIVGYSNCASSLGYTPDNIIDWGRHAPQQYYDSQDARWEDPMGFDERTGNGPPWSQDEFPSNSNTRDMINFEKFSGTPKQTNLGFDGRPNPSFSQRVYQQEYRGGDLGQNVNGDYERQGPFRPNSAGGRRTYQWNEPQNSLGRQDKDSFSRKTQRYDNDYFIDQDYNDQQTGQNYGYYEYEQSRRSPRRSMRRVEREQYRWRNDIGFEDDERTVRGMMMSPFRGFEVMDRMLDDMLDGLGMINDVMDRLSFEMETRLGREMASTDNLLDDAYADLLADPAVSELVGDSIRLGIPTAQSSSSCVINGIRRSRVEMIIPIEGSRNMGQIRLLADEAGILRLELGIGGRVINVQGGRERSFNAQKDIGDEVVIDATIVE